MHRIVILSLLGAALFLMAATCNQPNLKNLDQQVKRIEMSKAPCFGSCPVFTLSVYQNGVVTYRGERYTERVGLYAKKLTPEALQALFKAFDEANLWQYPSIFRSEVPDLPTVTITWQNADGHTKEIKGKEGRPPAVMELEEMLDKLANSSGWIQQEGEDYGLPAGSIANEIIVQLAPNVDPRAWVIQYGRQSMALKEQVSPNLNYWVVTYDTSAMPPQEMLSFLRRDPYVVGAEFNKTVQGRR